LISQGYSDPVTPDLFNSLNVYLQAIQEKKLNDVEKKFITLFLNGFESGNSTYTWVKNILTAIPFESNKKDQAEKFNDENLAKWISELNINDKMFIHELAKNVSKNNESDDYISQMLLLFLIAEK